MVPAPQVDLSAGDSADMRYSYGHHCMQGVSSKMEDRVVVEDWSKLEALQGAGPGHGGAGD